MTYHQPHPKPLQFYVSASTLCPYLPEKSERKIFTIIDQSHNRSINTHFAQQGFRRSQNMIYRPACEDCLACKSIRIRASDFHFSKRFCRILKKNVHLKRKVKPARATEEQFSLFQRYLKARHRNSTMINMSDNDYIKMVEETPSNTSVVEYYNGNNLEIVCLTDALEDGLSMVYSFFDPQAKNASLGSFCILDHVRIVRKLKLNYTYLGYWIQNSPQMAYKANFNALEIYHNRKWCPLNAPNIAKQKSTRKQHTLLTKSA